MFFFLLQIVLANITNDTWLPQKYVYQLDVCNQSDINLVMWNGSSNKVLYYGNLSSSQIVLTIFNDGLNLNNSTHYLKVSDIGEPGLPLKIPNLDFKVKRGLTDENIFVVFCVLFGIFLVMVGPIPLVLLFLTCALVGIFGNVQNL